MEGPDRYRRRRSDRWKTADATPQSDEDEEVEIARQLAQRRARLPSRNPEPCLAKDLEILKNSGAAPGEIRT